jgi:hypothetical protein
MFDFPRRKPPPLSLRGLKLYSVSPIGRPRALDRAALIEGLLSGCELFFGSAPSKFDIYGPYGIKKGQGVGIKAFRNKLAKRGHEDYYGFSGGIGEPAGFWYFSMDQKDGKSGWDHLVVWFDLRTKRVEVLDLAQAVMRCFPANYGYVKDFPADCLVPSESRPRRTLFGLSYVGDPEYAHWTSRIPLVLEGKVRNIYRYNLLNSAQAHWLQSLGLPEPVPLFGDVSVLAFAYDDAFQACATQYRQRVPAA